MLQVRRAIALGLLIALGVESTACGTLIYPERRGQRSGRIDPGVAVMDGIGLLLFIIPGMVAFAIDFSTGAIYLPGSRRGEVERVPFAGDDLADAMAAVEARTGLDVAAHGDDAWVAPLADASAARGSLVALAADPAAELPSGARRLAEIR
jgi:hypothetical protein